MKKLFILITLFTLIGCKLTEQQYWQVTCDSGFKTPLSHHTSIYEGMVVWKEYKKGFVSKRKMLPGEICTDTKVFKS